MDGGFGRRFAAGCGVLDHDPIGNTHQQEILFFQPALRLPAGRDPEMPGIGPSREITGRAAHPATRVEVARDLYQGRARRECIEGLSHIRPFISGPGDLPRPCRRD